MALDKAIKSGKEKRKPYRKGCKGCRNHGGCSYCEDGRLHKNKKRKIAAKGE